MAKPIARCEQCEKEFFTDNTRLKSHKHQFCQKSCYHEWLRNGGALSGQNHPNRVDLVTLTCHGCGKAFSRLPCHVESEINFCCKECHMSWQRNRKGASNPTWKRINVQCAHCGNTLQRSKSHVEHNKNHFCNHICYGEWVSVNKSGNNHPQWKGGEYGRYYGPNWNAQRRKARKRDGYKCQSCGLPQRKNGKALDVHHIKPFREFDYITGQNNHYLSANALDNLVSLCTSCHKKAEHGKIAFQLAMPIW